MSKKTKVAAIAGGALACMAAVAGTVIAVNTLLDSKKTEDYTVSEPVHELVVDSDAGSVRIVATRCRQHLRPPDHTLGHRRAVSPSGASSTAYSGSRTQTSAAAAGPSSAARPTIGSRCRASSPSRSRRMPAR